MLTFAEFQKHFGGVVVGGGDSGQMRDSMAIDEQAEQAKKWAERTDKLAARGALRMTAEKADKILHEKLVMKSTMRQAFKSFDTNHSGEISVQEFRSLVERSLRALPMPAPTIPPCYLRLFASPLLSVLRKNRSPDAPLHTPQVRRQAQRRRVRQAAKDLPLLER